MYNIVVRTVLDDSQVPLGARTSAGKKNDPSQVVHAYEADTWKTNTAGWVQERHNPIASALESFLHKPIDKLMICSDFITLSCDGNHMQINGVVGKFGEYTSTTRAYMSRIVWMRSHLGENYSSPSTSIPPLHPHTGTLYVHTYLTAV